MVEGAIQVWYPSVVGHSVEQNANLAEFLSEVKREFRQITS
jgi:hypothetical protein